MKILNRLFFFYLHLILIFSQHSLTFLSNYKDCYSITINIDPCNWRVFLDTINDYFILYDNNEEELPWPSRIIEETTNISKGEKNKVDNYANTIEITEYFSPVKFKSFPQELKQFYYYYTTDKCQDRRVWNSIDPNIKQLSLGIGLNVHQNKYSFVYTLYDNKIIDKKVFSFEHTSDEINRQMKYINFGETDNTVKKKYDYSFVSPVPLDQQTWGIYIYYIQIGNKNIPINSFAKINSGIQENIRSFMIYKIFKDFLLSNPKYQQKCKEYNLKDNIITIVCEDIGKNQIDEEVIFVVNDNIEFRVSLSNYFIWAGNTCKLSQIYFDPDNQNYELQVGRGFLEMFNLVEFNFEQRDITFYSKDIMFKEIKTNNEKPIMFILLASIMIICDFCLLVYTKIKFVN